MVLLLCGLAARLRADSSRDFLRDFFKAGAHRSLTGQFIVRDPLPTGELPSVTYDTTNLVRLDPTLLTVSCERIKKALLSELGARDNWRGKILINLHHSDNPDETIVVERILFGSEWSYRMETPDLLERSRFVSALVDVLLLEMAERGSEEPTQIPAWLSQGLSREVMLSSPLELVLEPPRTMENGVALNRLVASGRRTDPLALAHADLHTVPPLTLEELSWPRDGQFDGEAGEAFRSSAQLLVHELLQLPDGRAAMQDFLAELTRHLNWQLAFLSAFHADFGSQLDLEKWWALHLIQFTGRDLSQTWPSDESWRKLDEVLRPEMQVRTAVGEAPMRAQVTLQAIIKDWDISRQTKLLQEKAQQLFLLRMWVSQDLVYLVDEYRRALESYLRKRENGIYVSMGRSLYAPQLDTLARDTLRQLNELEAKREKLRPPLETAPVTASVRDSN